VKDGAAGMKGNGGVLVVTYGGVVLCGGRSRGGTYLGVSWA
jgi:hypothetical protein